MNELFQMICPCCRQGFSEGDDVIVCGSCGAPHHYDCWRDNGGCATDRCAGLTDVIYRNGASPAGSATAAFDIFSEEASGIYFGSSSVLLERIRLLRDRRNPDGLYAQLSFRSFDPRPVTAVFTEIFCKDSRGAELPEVISAQFDTENAGVGIAFGQNAVLRLSDNTTRGLRVILTGVSFADSGFTALEDAGTPIPEKLGLRAYLGDDSLVGYYKKSVSDKAEFAPLRIGGLLRCACGGFNGVDQSKCLQCGASLAEVIQYADRTFLTEKMTARLSAPAEPVSSGSGASKETAPVGTENKRKKKIAFGVAGAAALACAAVFWIVPSIRYAGAEKSLKNGKYDSAVSVFEALGDFRNAGERVKEAKYRKASDLLDEESFSEAAAVFAEITDYKDSDELKKECDAEDLFIKGTESYENGDFYDAAGYFDQIGTIKEEAPEWAKKSHYAYAEKQFKNKDYDSAASHYESAGDYKKAAEKAKEAHYLFGKESMDRKYWRQAYNHLSKVRKYKDVPQFFDEVTYQYGNWLVKHDSGEEAIDIFSSLGDYKKSRTHINEIRYDYVSKHKNSSDKTTYKYLKALKKAGYQDSASLYEKLFTWKVSVLAANTDRDDNSTVKKSVSKNCSYFHFEFALSDGPVDGKVSLKPVIVYPDGEEVRGGFQWEKMKAGDSFGLVWDQGLYEDSSDGKTGQMYIRLYNIENGDLMAEFTMKVKK